MKISIKSFVYNSLIKIINRDGMKKKSQLRFLIIFILFSQNSIKCEPVTLITAAVLSIFGYLGVKDIVNDATNNAKEIVNDATGNIKVISEKISKDMQDYMDKTIEKKIKELLDSKEFKEAMKTLNTTGKVIGQMEDGEEMDVTIVDIVKQAPKIYYIFILIAGPMALFYSIKLFSLLYKKYAEMREEQENELALIKLSQRSSQKNKKKKNTQSKKPSRDYHF